MSERLSCELAIEVACKALEAAGDVSLDDLCHAAGIGSRVHPVGHAPFTGGFQATSDASTPPEIDRWLQLVATACANVPGAEAEAWHILRDYFAEFRQKPLDIASGDRYKIVGTPLGRGGQAVVVRAEVVGTTQRVAIKFFTNVKDGVDFDRERKALQALSGHPHVIAILNDDEYRWRRGRTDSAEGFPPEGCHYLVMELGETNLEEHLGLKGSGVPSPLTFKEAANVVAQVAEAVDHAHTQHLLHRDIKPANVVRVGLVWKLMDFGISRWMTPGQVELTDFGRGTPSYMAPEQLSSNEIGEAGTTKKTDAYGLGVLLYECLTGQVPFTESTDLQSESGSRKQKPCVSLAKQIEGNAAPTPTSPHGPVPRQLEIVCQRCLCKNPSLRPTPREVADTLRAFVDGKRASRMKALSLRQHASEYSTRNPSGKIGRAALRSLLILGLSLVVTGVMLVIVVGLWQQLGVSNGNLTKATEQLTVEKARSESLNTQLVADQASVRNAQHDPASAVFLLTRALASAPDHEASRQASLRKAIAGSADSLHTLEATWTYDAKIKATAISPNGWTLAIAGEDGILRVHRWGTWELIAERSFGAPYENSLAGIAYGLESDCIYVATNAGKIHTVAVKPSLPDLDKSPVPSSVRPLGLAVSGRRGVLTVGGTVEAGVPNASAIADYDYMTRKLVSTPFAVPGNVSAVAYSPDGHYFATSGHRDNKLRVWDAETGKVVLDGLAHPGPVFAVTFTPDSTAVITGCIDGGIRLFRMHDGQPLLEPFRHGHPIRSLAAHRGESGDYVLAGAEDGTARVWDISTGVPIGQPLYHSGDVRAVAISADGKSFVTTGFDHTVRVWRIRPAKGVKILRHPAAVAAIGFSTDGKFALTGCRDSEAARGRVFMWTTDGKPVRSFPQDGEALAVGVANDVVYGAGNDGHLRLWKSDGQAAAAPIPHGDGREVIIDATATADGRFLAFAGRGRILRILDRETSEVRQLEHGSKPHWIFSVSFSPDGKRVLAPGRNAASMWDVASGRLMGKSMEHPHEIRWAGFSPGGDRVVTCGYDGTVGVWNGVTGSPIRMCQGHQGRVYAGAFSPVNSDFLATAGADKTVRIWNMAKPGFGAQVIVHDSRVLCLAFTPDGKSLATGCSDGSVRVWSVEDGAWQGAALFHQSAVTRIQVRPGSLNAPTVLLSASNDGTAKLWTLPEPMKYDAELLWLKFEVETGMSPSRSLAEPFDSSDPLRSKSELLLILDVETWKSKKEELNRRMVGN